MQTYDPKHLPHVFNDLVNLDCDSIKDSIGINYNQDPKLILNDGRFFGIDLLCRSQGITLEI